MAKRKTVAKFFQDSVPANGTETWESPALPSGKWIQISEYGGCDVAIGDGKDSIMALQWGTSGSWETLRAWTGNMNFTRELELTGDGSKKLRLVRMNKSNQAKPILVWIRAVVDEVV